MIDKRKLKLLGVAILGSVIGYTVISLFILPVTILQYIAIEAIISILHLMYNTAKSAD
jgi:hypothetical protein